MNREKLERDIVETMLGQPKALAAKRNAVKGEHFRYWRRIVEAILAAFDQGVSLETENLIVVGKLPQEEIEKLWSVGPSFSGNLSIMLRVLAEDLIRDAARELAVNVSSEEDAFKILDEVGAFQRNAESIISSNTRPNKNDLLEQYGERCLKPEEHRRISTPFPTLDRMLDGGLQPGGFTLLGGTPGSGKTSFMLALALHAAQGGTKAALIEGEMTADEIMERLNGISVGEDITRLRQSENFGTFVSPFLSKLQELPLEIVPLYDRTLENLASEVISQVHLGAKLIFVDYLQVFSPTRRDKSDEFMEIRETSRRLRSLALQHGVHLFVASSLNRSEVNADRISLHSFYGSSGLGHDCSLGLILSGEGSDLQELVNPERSVRLRVVKNRNGARGDIALKFHLRSQRFEELSEVRLPSEIFEDRENGEQPF
jgi:replicative DNA helicase